MYVECTWSWSWEHDKSLDKGQQDLTKLNTITSSICVRLETYKISYLALIGIAHQLRSMWNYDFITIFIKTNSPSTLNRNGRISKSELYHTSQQFSQYDCPIRIFSHKYSVCIWNKLYVSFYLKHVMIMSPFKILNKVWFVK
jgi:hypothetical protein